MFARLRCANDKFRVKSRRRNDVNDVDLFVVSDPIESLVAVDVLLVEVVISRPLLALLRMAGNDAGEITQFRLTEGRTQLVRRVSAKSEQRDAKFTIVPRLRPVEPGQTGGQPSGTQAAKKITSGDFCDRNFQCG